MAGIQQAFNQTLMSAQVGTALFAHSPAGQVAAEVHSIKKNMPKTEKQIELASEGVGPNSSEATDRAFTEAFKQGVQESKRLYELRPSEESFSQYREMEETLEEWESALKYSYDKRIKTKQDQKKALDMRMKLLEADPNPLNIKKTKVEV